MNKETIASRANNNKLGVKFYKSYVTNVKRVAVRDVPEHVLRYIEEDYIFSYKGKQYRVNEHIVPYSVEGHAFITLEEAKRAARMAYKIAMLDEKKDLYRRLNNVQV